MKFIKFFFTVCIGSAVDLLIFITFTVLMEPTPAHIISYTSGMLCNFFLQKKYVFKLNRKLKHTFIISLTLWIIGLILSSLLLEYILQKTTGSIPPLGIKVFIMGITFFYNYFSRKFAFKDSRKEVSRET